MTEMKSRIRKHRPKVLDQTSQYIKVYVFKLLNN